MQTQFESQAISKANEVIKGANFTELKPCKNPAVSMLVLAHPDYSIYMALNTPSVYIQDIKTLITYKLK